MQMTLRQFEIVDGALSAFCAAERQVDNGADPRIEVRAENRLLDAIIEVVGYERAAEIPSLTEWAATVVCKAMTGSIEIVDGESA